MERVDFLSLRTMVVIMALLLFVLTASSMMSVAQAQNRTTPGLVQAGLWVDISQQSCMDRARDALTAAGLILHNPTPSARGGNNENLFAIITCVPCSNQMFVNVAVANSPGYSDDNRTAIFLRDYMRTGQSPDGGGTAGGVGGSNSSRCVWDEMEEGWQMTWTRRGDSNVFDVRGRKGPLELTAVQTIRIEGNRVSASRDWASDGNTCEMEGTIGSDGRTVTGTYRCRSGGPYRWQATISGNCSDLGGGGSGSIGTGGGNVAGGNRSGGICDDPRTLAIVDEWLVRANPPQNQQPGWSVRYEAWGRLVGRSASANLTVSGPPDTRMSRCEWLWYYSTGLRSTNLGTLREYVERRRQ